MQKLAKLRIREARILLDAAEHSGAYHIAGFAVECALKACIAKKTRRFEFADAKHVREAWTHKLEILLGLAGLKAALDADMATNPILKVNCSIVSKWDVEVRYRCDILKNEATDICDAIDDSSSGVLQWIQKQW